MMIAAIYARKSTDQKVADESKSTTRQLEEARKFAERNGWHVADEFVFVDDGISGAEFGKRPALTRMRSMIENRRAPFHVLIVSELKSLGREMSETGYVLKKLDEAGVDVREYVHGKSLVPKNHLAKLMSSVEAFSAEDHQSKTSERVTEAHIRLANSGKVTGGRVFGYKNVNIYNGTDQHGRPLRSHVERAKVPEEAAVVERIFELHASGLGLKTITKRLIQEGAPAPKPFVRKSEKIPTPIGKWAPSTVRTILTREIYKGLLVYNKTKKRDTWGKVAQKARPESEWIKVPVEHLRIVPTELWERSASRRKDVAGKTLRFESGRLSGRPPMNGVQNLLAGLATCGVCGGGLVVETSARKNGRKKEYVCHRHRHNGTCTNALRIAIEEMNETILSSIEQHALTPEAVEQAIRLSERDDVREQQDLLAKERQEAERRIGRLVAVIADGGDAASLVASVRELENRVKAIDVEMRGLQPVPRLAPQVVENRLAEWRRLLRQSVTQGRAVLQRLLQGRIVFVPRESGDGYDFRCDTRFDKLFTGIVVERPSWVGTGSIPDFSAEDTHDADYGALLEQFHGKRLASPTGFEPVF